MSHFDRFVGIDISKNCLDIYCHPDGLAFSVANTSDGIGRLLAKAGGGGVAFGCEATGGYEDLLLVTLSQAGTPGYCLHPADIRAFARLKGKRAKTDALDAKAIAEALVAAVTARKPVVRTKDQGIIKELTALRRTLIISLSELKSLKARMSAAVAAKTIATLIATNLRAIKTIEAAIRQAIKDNPDARHKAEQILSAPGAGPVLAAELIGAMPELGTLTSRQAASLVGVAPHPRQSGERKRSGKCQGGRPKIRRVLYMAALSVIKAKRQPLCAFYEKLRANGKPFKVAIVAIMRKLIVTLNAMIKAGMSWCEIHST